MNILRRFGFGVPATFAAMGLVMFLGCGDDSGLGKRYPVTGTVKYKGQPVSKGRISFSPDGGGGRACGGDIDNGAYSLSTTGAPNDGALPGKYKVSVTALEVDTTEMQKIAKGGQFHHDKAFKKANEQAKKLVPEKYALADTSGLTREVEARANTINFDLTD
jgi:hypothetical protein